MVSVHQLLTVFTYLIILQICCISCNQSAPDTRNDASEAESADSKAVPDTGVTTDINTADTDKPEQTSEDLGSKIVNYAGTLTNIPYKEAGRDASGFDCSGFVYYVYKNFSIDIPHSSRHMAQIGQHIEVEEAREGDLIFFRGTDSTSTEVGHVGIVISGAGEKVKFIHSSSAPSSPCVRVDSLEKPNYKKRFLMVKRVLQQPMNEE